MNTIGLKRLVVRELILEPDSGQTVTDSVQEAIEVCVSLRIPVTVFHNDKPYKLDYKTVLNMALSGGLARHS
jgi:hypothetical protein